MTPDDEAFGIAARIADGSGIDWAAAESSPVAVERRGVLNQLKAIASVAAVHRAPRGEDVNDPLSTPSQWGPLTLIGRIAEGRFGDVYRAWEPRLQRLVALKLLHADSAATDASPTRAIEEARLLARVRHSNVLTVYGADCFDGRVGIWTEFIEGRTLEAIVAAGGPLPAADAIGIGIDLCGALAAVHDADLLHRDVKAQNVMRETGGRIVLMDFGTGHDLERLPPREGDLSGTPLYLAPEIFTGGRPSIASDVYGLAVLCFYLLTGRHPVAGQTLEDVRAGHQTRRAVRLRDARPELPEALVETIERGLAQDSSQRYESAAAFEEALRGALVPTEIPGRAGDGPRRRMWMTATVAVAIVAISLATWRWWHPGVAIALTARDWVLVADFENRTGEPLFDGTAQYAVQRELANSSLVRVLPRPRIEDMLRLMRKPLDSPIDPVLAREIAIRDGEVRAIVTGRIEHAGAGYVLRASVVSPQTAEVLASVSARASSQAATPEALTRLSTDLRGRLGEAKAEIDKSHRQLEPVTTPSLNALQSYTRAVELGDRGQWPAALEMARQAVDEDPEFASARIWLGWALSNTGHKPEGQEMARTAVARVNSVTEWERYWILGSYHYGLGDSDKAAAEFEALLELKPDHLWALNNLAQITRLNKYAIRLAELRPNDLRPRLMIIEGLLRTGADPAEVEPQWRRALTLLSAQTAEEQQSQGVLLLVPAHLDLLKEDPRGATNDIERALGDWRFGATRGQQPSVPVFLLYAAMGEIDAGRRLIANSWSNLDRHAYSALADYYSDKIVEARDEISGVTTDMFGTNGNKWSLPVWLMIRTGRLAQAEAVLNFVELHEGLGDPYALMAARGDLALARGNVDRAIALLEPAVLHLPTILYQPDSLGTFYRSSAVLAEARLRKGDARKAIEAIQSALEVRSSSRLNAGVFLVTLRSRLAALYRHLGRTSEADALDARVAKVLELADPAFLRRLKQLSEAGLSVLSD